MITVTSDLTTNPSAASVVFGPLEDPDGRQPPAELPRRPLPPAPRVPKHAQWTRQDGEIGGQTTRLGWHTPDRARAGVFPTVPLTRPTGHEDEQVMGPWPGDRP
jgi:hypothetical protein